MYKAVGINKNRKFKYFPEPLQSHWDAQKYIPCKKGGTGTLQRWNATAHDDMWKEENLLPDFAHSVSITLVDVLMRFRNRDARQVDLQSVFESNHIFHVCCVWLVMNAVSSLETLTLSKILMGFGGKSGQCIVRYMKKETWTHMLLRASCPWRIWCGISLFYWFLCGVFVLFL
jgi:hypothetical protein